MVFKDSLFQEMLRLCRCHTHTTRIAIFVGDNQKKTIISSKNNTYIRTPTKTINKNIVKTMAIKGLFVAAQQQKTKTNPKNNSKNKKLRTLRHFFFISPFVRFLWHRVKRKTQRKQ
eukprot:GEMP01074351.1.p1 GENE.GEMP01074351.1~~GEMP01074351.1.p1  ORF type:complete len:116 (-),score=5.69 GEMP01074351.1:764-1111(-)